MKVILSFILVLWWAVSASAQLYRYLDTNQGLSSRRVLAIEKDTKGYVWLLTHEGVDRYNGMEFVFYPLNDGEKNIRQFPNLNSLQTDSKGNVWVLGKHGCFFRYSPMKDRFELKLDFVGRTQTKKRLPLTMTTMDREDNLWMCTKTEQYIYRTETGELDKLQSDIHEEITCMVQGEGNRYFLGTSHNIYPATLHGNTLRTEREPALDSFHIIRHLYYHPHTRQLLINTLSDGFYLYDTERRTLQPIGNMKDVNINRAVPMPHKEDEILVATDGNGVYHLNLRTRTLTPFLNANRHSSNKMNGDIIKDLHIDQEGRIWMAVFPTGVTIHSAQYPEYEWLKHSPENPNTLVNNQVTCLMEDSDGDIWVATENGVCCYNTRTNRWTSMLSSYQQDGHEQNHVFISLCEPTPGTILAGGYMSGMYRINKQDMKPEYFSLHDRNNPQIRPDKYIRSIYRDEEGSVWAGGYYNFERLDPATGAMEHYSTEYPITVITARNRDRLWIGTTGGLYEFDKRQKRMMPVNLTQDIGSINTILQDGERTTYIGTNGNGMYVYHNQTQELENYITTNSALISNNIYCILHGDDPDELMISTENELVCFETKEKIFLNWTREQGLMSCKFNTAAGLHTRDGVIAFGSGDGLIVIRDSIELPRTFSSKLVFSDFSIHYQKMLPGEKGSPLTRPIDETEEITLSHDQNIFALNVSSINYDCPSRILYSWKLEGFFDEWTTPGKAHLIRYTNISPGEYTLKVRAILLDDGHTLEERHLHITVKPPFSRSIWAMMIYTALLALAAAAIMRFLWMRKDSQISKEKIRFFINTAHDIRTPLTLIKAPLGEISRSETLSAKGRAQLDMAIHSTDKLAEMATKLIEFQKEEMYTPAVNVTLYELNAYVKEFMEEFAPYARQKGISLETDLPPLPVRAWIDRNKTDSILHNLVGNALKYTPTGGRVSVKLRGSRTHWFLRISDTGIGITATDRKKMFKHLFRGENAVNRQITGTGIGMLQTYRLVKRHHGRITVTSQENEGTTFHLRFPIDDRRYRKKERPNQDPRPTPTLPVREGETIRTAPPLKGVRGMSSATLPILLIVEDHTDLRDFLRQTLSGTYRISEAANGQEALDLIAHEQPDLVLSDIMMPVMRGDDLCRTLKSDMQTSHIPVILLTALNDRESIIHGLQVKADSYVVKPFDVDILKANIASVLANKELVRQRFARMDYRTEDLKDEVPGVDLDREFIVKVTETVKKNLGSDFNVDSLCAALNMSRTSFYNKIKALTDQPPADFVRHIRLNEACTMLKSRKYTVAEVSDRLGYNDPKYFTELFKKHFGMTPSAYMKNEK